MNALVRDIVMEVPDNARELFRRLEGPERFSLQGFPPSVALSLDPKVWIKASGDAYPPPLIIATLGPMIRQVSASAISFAAWPPSEILQKIQISSLKFMEKEFQKPGMIVDRLAARKALCKSRKRKRSTSDSD